MTAAMNIAENAASGILQLNAILPSGLWLKQDSIVVKFT